MCAAPDAWREWKTRIFHIAQMESTRKYVRKLMDLYDCTFRYDETIILNCFHHINIIFARFPVGERIAECAPYQL